MEIKTIIDKVRKQYPKYEIVGYYQYKQKTIFNLVPEGSKSDDFGYFSVVVENGNIDYFNDLVESFNNPEILDAQKGFVFLNKEEKLGNTLSSKITN